MGAKKYSYSLQAFAADEADYRVWNPDISSRYGIDELTADQMPEAVNIAAETIFNYMTENENAINYEGMDQAIADVLKERYAR